jgi:hypothetical protein
MMSQPRTDIVSKFDAVFGRRFSAACDCDLLADGYLVAQKAGWTDLIFGQSNSLKAAFSRKWFDTSILYHCR